MLKIILLGPTAVGKTSLSLKLAAFFNAPIISADSRQCYKYLNIGTSKPTFEELCQARHYNISCLDLNQQDSAAAFLKRTEIWEKKLTAQHPVIIYCGGSTLHLRVLIEPFDDLPKADQENIRSLEKQIDTNGIEALYEKLHSVDPNYADKIDGLNQPRIVRALDVWMQTGKPFSSFHTKSQHSITPDKNTMVFGLHRERQKLYTRINKRAEIMLTKGLIKETDHILSLGYSPELQSLNTVGYKQAIEYLNGTMDKQEVLRQMQTKTRRYAKRQLTWFRRWNFINWLDLDRNTEKSACTKIINLVEDQLNND